MPNLDIVEISYVDSVVFARVLTRQFSDIHDASGHNHCPGFACRRWFYYGSVIRALPPAFVITSCCSVTSPPFIHFTVRFSSFIPGARD